LALGIVVGRCKLSEASLDGQLDRGLDALVRAIGGERAAYPEAEKAFARAAGASVVDRYPLFLLELTRAIADGRAPIADPDVRPVIVALAAGDFARAVADLPSIPSGFEGREQLERAVVALARHAAERKKSGD